jgi:hypothetical protein
MSEAAGTKSWTQQEPPPWVVVTFSVLVMGVLAFLMVWSISAGLDSKRESSPIEGGVGTSGTVVDVTPDGDSTFKARIEFEDRQGAKHRFTKQAGSDKPSVGDQVEVSYDPDDPSDARDLTTNKDIWKYQLAPGVVLAVTEVLLFPTGLVLYFRRRRRNASA